jgi:hypothetical protein
MDNEIVQHLIDIKENLGRQDERLDKIETAVMGNGQPGLAQKVEALQTGNSWTRGVGAGIVFLLGTLETWPHLGHHK